MCVCVWQPTPDAAVGGCVGGLEFAPMHAIAARRPLHMTTGKSTTPLCGLLTLVYIILIMQYSSVLMQVHSDASRCMYDYVVLFV